MVEGQWGKIAEKISEDRRRGTEGKAHKKWALHITRQGLKLDYAYTIL